MFKQAGQGLHFFKTQIGPVGLAWTPRGVSRLEIGRATSDETLAALTERAPGLAVARPVPASVRALATRLKAHLGGKSDPLTDIPVDLRGTYLKARLLHDEGYVRNAEHARGLAHLQQVDKKLGRVIKRVGPYAAVPDKPQPPYDTLVRACGLSNAKVEYVRDLAARVADGRLNLKRLRHLDDDGVVAALTEVRGIGVWSAHMHMIFHLGRLDVLPTGDLGVCAGAARLYGFKENTTPSQLTELAEKWRPYRSMGSWYLWRALDGGGL